MSLPASLSSFSFSFAYDVFLSFRGSDTRYGFTGNLYKALSDKGINTFIDDEELQKGEEITPTLLKAIEESRIAIVVFSKNYASSTFCLTELVKILECLKQKGRLVWPVFYKVDPSDVRHMKESYGKAMAKHEARFKNDKEKVEKWKLALQEAANLSGSHFQPGIEYEHKFIERIVKEVSRRTSRIILPIADYPVGMESRLQKVNSLLELGSNEEVIMVGIYGAGGIGKTTIARAIYNLIADQFDSVCFLADVRDNSFKRGLVQLQEAMLSRIFGEKDIKLTDAFEGISVIKRRLSRKRVLLILDDVDKLDQLKRLVGELGWFGSGSRIIITTRNEHLLRLHGVKRKYEVETLSHGEAHELFIWNAFKDKDFDPSYLDVLNNLVVYCSGLPLALEVIGCNLFDKGLDEWKSALQTYELVPEKTIQQILKISFDDLGDFQKEIFLDIACFFKGYELKYVEKVLLDGRGIPPQVNIGVLMDKSLIKIDSNGIVRLHDLIEDMGKEIVRKESPWEPGKRSRLWFYEDILHVFEENTGTDNIGAIVFHSNEDTEVYWDGKAFEKMTNLRVLIIEDVSFSTAPNHLPNSLRYLEWKKYQWSALPSNFNPRKLIILILSENCLASFKSPWNFRSLSEINLQRSKFLDQVPDISGALNLRKLILDGCTNLIEIHGSVGLLDKLCYLSASGCTNLKIFPAVIKSTCLESLELSGCSSLESVPVMSGVMEKITKVCLDNYAPDNYVPDQYIDNEAFHLRRSDSNLKLTIGFFKLPKVEKIMEGLGHLSKRRVEDYESVTSAISSHAVSSNMKSLVIAGCSFTIANHSTWLPCCSSSEELDFFSNHSIHECLSSWLPCFPDLEVLQLISFYVEEDIPVWHPGLANLRSFGVKVNNFADEFLFTCLHCMPKLQELDLHFIDFTILPECIKECHFLRILKLDFCKQLQEIRGLPPNIEYLSATDCMSLNDLSQSLLLSQRLHETVTRDFKLPGAMIPQWFSHRQPPAESLSIWVRNKFPERILLCFVRTRWIRYDLLIGPHKHDFYVRNPHIHLMHKRIGKDSDEELTGDKWTRVEIPIDNNALKDRTHVSSIGVHVCNMGENNREDIRFTDPNPGKSKVDEDMGGSDINPNNHPLLKNWSPLLDMNFFGIQCPYWYNRKIWEMQALEKVKILMCQIEAGCLPTCEYLFCRNLINSPLCPICETEYETIEHVFLLCPWTRAVWFGSDLQWVIDLERGRSFGGWLNKILIRNNVGVRYQRIHGIMGNICWAIWKARNEYVVEGKSVDSALALLRVKTLYNQYPAHSCPLVQKISYPTNDITNQGQKGLFFFYKDISWSSVIGESSGERDEVIESDNEVKGKSIVGACNSNTEVNEGQEEAREINNEVEGKSIMRTCNGNTEVNEGHERCSWPIEFAIQLLRRLPLPEIKNLLNCWLWKVVLLLASLWSLRIVFHIYSRYY